MIDIPHPEDETARMHVAPRLIVAARRRRRPLTGAKGLRAL
jgi:hypothetical protein